MRILYLLHDHCALKFANQYLQYFWPHTCYKDHEEEKNRLTAENVANQIPDTTGKVLK